MCGWKSAYLIGEFFRKSTPPRTKKSPKPLPLHQHLQLIEPVSTLIRRFR